MFQIFYLTGLYHFDGKSLMQVLHLYWVVYNPDNVDILIYIYKIVKTTYFIVARIRIALHS